MQGIGKKIAAAVVTLGLLLGATATPTLAKPDRPQLKKIFKHLGKKRDAKIGQKDKSEKS